MTIESKMIELGVDLESSIEMIMELENRIDDLTATVDDITDVIERVKEAYNE